MKTQGKLVLKIDGRIPKIEVAGDMCLRRPRPRPIQSCTADDVDDDDEQFWGNDGTIFSVCAMKPCGSVKIASLFFSLGTGWR